MQTAMSKCHANCKLKIYNTYTHRQEKKKERKKERNLGRIPVSHLIIKEQKMKKKKKKTKTNLKQLSRHSLLQGNHPHLSIEPMSPALWADSLPSELPGKPNKKMHTNNYLKCKWINVPT